MIYLLGNGSVVLEERDVTKIEQEERGAQILVILWERNNWMTPLV